MDITTAHGLEDEGPVLGEQATVDVLGRLAGQEPGFYG
jgi:hypothetical protein